MILGSPAFMSPEQASENAATPASDLWGLGATLYFAVEGRPPFDKGQPISTLTAVLHEEPEMNGSAGALTPAIAALLTKDPALRPSSTEARALLTGLGARVRTASATQATKEVTAATPTATMTPTPVAARAPVAAPPAPARARSARDRARDGAARTSGRTSRWLWALGGAVGLIAVVALLLTQNDDGARSRESARGDRGAAAPADDPANDDGATDTAGEAGAGTDTAVDLDGWIGYEHPTVGYTISYPEGWEVIPGRGGPSNTDFDDPAATTYMRVGWRSPPGPDVIAALETQSAAYGDSHDGYQELRLEEVEYRDYDAGEWEYTWEEDGITLHAVNLQFITPDGDYGFALNFVTREEDWTTSLPLLERFKAAFQPPSA